MAVADSVSRGGGLTIGLLAGQDVFTVPDMSSKLEPLAAIQDYAVRQVGAFPHPTLKGAADAIAALPAVTMGVQQLRDAFDAGSDNGWDQARADPIYGSQPMTNEEAFCAFLAALEPVAAPDPAAIREAALLEAAAIAQDYHQKALPDASKAAHEIYNGGANG